MIVIQQVLRVRENHVTMNCVYSKCVGSRLMGSRNIRIILDIYFPSTNCVHLEKKVHIRTK